MSARIAADAFVAGMQRLRAGLPGAARDTLFRIAQAAYEQVQHTDRFKTQSGTLKARTYSTAEGDGVALVADTPYAYWVENGRGPVTAGSRRFAVASNGRSRLKRVKTGMKMLRFVINGQVFFRRSVGPAKPRRFMEESAWAAAYAVQDAGEEVLTPYLAA